MLYLSKQIKDMVILYFIVQTLATFYLLSAIKDSLKGCIHPVTLNRGFKTIYTVFCIMTVILGISAILIEINNWNA